MSDLLTAALAATEAQMGGPVITGEQHDTGAINWVNGLSDPGEMITCGYMPALRRRDGEQDAEYAARITPLVKMLPKAERDKIMGAAVKRANLDTSTGKVAVMVAGQPPWHGLGVQVRDAVSSADAIRLASMDWQVRKNPMAYRGPTGEWAEADGVYSLTRDDTGAMLGSVGKMYQPFQNSEGFKFLDSLIGKFGARYESAGAIYGGKKVWMLVHLPRQRFAVNGTDAVEPYAIFTNSHDGTTAAKCFPTSQRVVCANTFRLAQSDADKGLTIRHTGSLGARVESAERALGLAVEEFSEFSFAAEAMAATPVDHRPYFDRVLDAVCDVTAAEAGMGADALSAVLKVTEAERDLARHRYELQIKRRSATLDDLLGRYESERCGTNGMRGSAWAAFNAVTESADFGAIGGRFVGDKNTRQSRRFESILTGRADEAKQVAYETVRQYVAG